MSLRELPEWLLCVTLRGYDDPEPDPSGEGDPPADGDDPESEQETEGLDKLRKALAAERLKTKRLEKNLKARSGPPAEDEAEEDSEEETEPPKKRSGGRRSQADIRLDQLTKRFQDLSFRDAVRAAAKKFEDPDDAVSGIDRSLISMEQDEDDPSIVMWDESEITAAVKDLAKRKPYLLKREGDGSASSQNGTKSTRPSGGKFSGRPQKETTQEAQIAGWKQRFPATRGFH